MTLICGQRARTLAMSVVRGNPEVIYSGRVFRILTHLRHRAGQGGSAKSSTCCRKRAHSGLLPRGKRGDASN
jgi:hypothetical protein